MKNKNIIEDANNDMVRGSVEGVMTAEITAENIITNRQFEIIL